VSLSSDGGPFADFARLSSSVFSLEIELCRSPLLSVEKLLFLFAARREIEFLESWHCGLVMNDENQSMCCRFLVE